MHRWIENLNPDYTRAVRAAAQDPVWARWEYTADEWQEYVERKWAEAKHHWQWRLILEPTLLPVGIGAFLWVFSPSSTKPPLLIVGALVLILGMGILLLDWRGYRKSRRLHEARRQSQREICVGPLGVSEAGGVIPLAQLPLLGGFRTGGDPLRPIMSRLRDVNVDRQHPHLLRFEGLSERGYPTAVVITIPQGHEAEAEHIINRFHNEILRGAVPVEKAPAAIPSAPPIGPGGQPWVGGTSDSQRYGQQEPPFRNSPPHNQ